MNAKLRRAVRARGHFPTDEAALKLLFLVFADAAAAAETVYTSTSVSHVFLYNSSTDTGYLVSDLNNDDQFETVVVLKNAGSAPDFSYARII